MLTAYRIVYGVVLLVFLGNVLSTSHFGTVPPQASALLIAYGASICGLVLLLVRFSGCGLGRFGWLRSF